MTPDVFQAMARYNCVMNDTLYGAAETLSDAERRADKGAFFKSIHGTLEHLLWGDLAWMHRLSDRVPTPPKFGSALAADFEGLRQRRRDVDSEIGTWTSGLDADWLLADMTWTATTDGVERTQPRWLLVQHMFNHQTHHRGQVTTLLTQAGVDVGVTDLPRLV